MKIIRFLYLHYHLQIEGHIPENVQKKKYVSFHETARLIVLKIKIKMTNKLHGYDINRRRSRHGHKYTKYKNCLSMIIYFATPKQHGRLNSDKS